MTGTAAAQYAGATANDGLLPPVFQVLHPRFLTPYLGQLLLGLVVGIVGGLVPISILGELVSIGTLFAVAVVCASILYIRRNQPELKRQFRCPFVPVIPIGGILCCLLLMIGLPLDTWVRLVVCGRSVSSSISATDARTAR